MRRQYSPKGQWEYIRPQIERLIESDDSRHWLVALILLIPAMDKVYQDRTGKGRNDYSARDVTYFFVKNSGSIVEPRPENCGTFFPSKCVLEEDGDYKLFCYIANNLINALKHDNGIRGNIELTKAFSDGMTLIFPIAYKLNTRAQFKSVTIKVDALWINVRSKLDLHYGTGNEDFAASVMSMTSLWTEMGEPDIKTFIEKYRRSVYEGWRLVESETGVSDSPDN